MKKLTFLSLFWASVALGADARSIVGYSDGDGLPPAAARIQPHGIACAGEKILVADWGKQALRLVEAVTSTIPVSNGTISGGVAVDTAGNVWGTDPFRHQVRSDLLGLARVAAGDGTGGFSGDGGPATLARLNAPLGIAADKFGNIYVADSANQRVRKIELSTGIITTVAGGNMACSGACDGPTATGARLATPMGVAVDPLTGDLVIAEYLGQRVRKLLCGGAPITGACAITTIAGTGVVGSSGDGGPAKLATFQKPTGVAVSADGRVFVADLGNHSVRVIGLDGTIQRFAGTGFPGISPDGDALATKLESPRSVAICGDSLIVGTTGVSNRIYSIPLGSIAPPPTPTQTSTIPISTPTRTATIASTNTPTQVRTPTATCPAHCV